MAKNKRTLNDNFELKGNWFLPGSRENTVNGSVNYSHGDIHLETIGSVESPGEIDFISAIKLAVDQTSYTIFQDLKNLCKHYQILHFHMS